MTGAQADPGLEPDIFAHQDRLSYFERSLAAGDPEVARLAAAEERRQSSRIELIASENFVSRAVRAAQATAFCNKTVEGYPGARYHGGAEQADALERLAEARACRLFGAAEANVQPHSGSQANLAVFKALLKPGDSVLAMDLKAGGHLSHGARANLSGRFYRIHAYGVRADDGRIDQAAVAELAARHRPKLIVAGGSSYPRAIDYVAMRAAADSVSARLLVDMAHFAGLVAGHALPSPVAVADVVTTTTYKSLRGARGGLILWNDPDLSRSLRAAVFPGVQGSPLLNMMAAKAVGLAEAQAPSFAAYAQRVQANARAFAEGLLERGLSVVTGGTDTPLVLVDLRPLGIDGQAASDRLARIGITSNKNLVPDDPRPPAETSGLRFGLSAMTTRGLTADQARSLAGWTADCLLNAGGRHEDLAEAASALAVSMPFYGPSEPAC